MNNAFPSYQIRSHVFSMTTAPVWYLRDMPTRKTSSRDEQEASRAHLTFHIESGDYFGTLATIMALIADALSNDNDAAKQRCIETLVELRDDLVYLQERYAITSKET